MFHRTMCVILLGFATVGLLLLHEASIDSAKGTYGGRDADAIRSLIPQAAGMRMADVSAWWKALAVLAESPTTPKLAEIEAACPHKSLTLFLFTLRPGGGKEAEDQFRYLARGVPPASAMVAEMRRPLGELGDDRQNSGMLTLVHADRITDFVCAIHDDTASGSVSFEVPGLYQGKTRFLARRREGKWRIEEFCMPAYQLDVVRNAQGVWKRVTAGRESPPCSGPGPLREDS